MFNLIEEKIRNQSITENGAVGYNSSKSALVDINYQVSSLRHSSEDEIIKLFDKAFHEHKEYCVKWLFFARDVREGLGERRLFRICYKRLVELDIEIFYNNLNIIYEYGRWDDLISLFGISEVTDKKIITIINSQLFKDLVDMDNGKSISLLAKWMPSENASSKKTKQLARHIMKLMDISPRKYRLTLSKLRRYLDVVEVKMCGNEWNNIDYEKVPSLANLRYKNAFMRHDKDRRFEYIESVKKGDAKLNMDVATPVDVVSKYKKDDLSIRIKDYDDDLELAWHNLKDVMVSDTLVVADGSGSMCMPVSGKTTALDVATALAIYTSEHNTGVYKDKYITFSSRPQFVDMSNDESLREKILTSREHLEVSNTNIEAVFDLILGVAIENNISNEEMINNILIISDIEFDEAQRGWLDGDEFSITLPLFENIKERYVNVGYDLPKLIFWNVASRTGTIPLLDNRGVTLISGFSQNVLKMIMNNKYNPYDVLIDIITSKRYDKVEV